MTTSTVLSPMIREIEANLCFMGIHCNSPHLPVADCFKCHRYLHQTCGGNYRHRLVTINDVEIESVNVFYCRGCDPVLAQEKEAAGPPKGGVEEANPNQEKSAKPPGLLEMAIEVSPCMGSLLAQGSLFTEEDAVHLTFSPMEVNTSLSSIGKEAKALALSPAQVLHGQYHLNDTEEDSAKSPPIGSVEQASPNDENRVKPSGTTAMAIVPSDHPRSAISPSPVHLQPQISATTDDVMMWLTMPPLKTRPSSSTDGREAISLVSYAQLSPETYPTQETEESALQRSTSPIFHSSTESESIYPDAESDSRRKVSNTSNVTLQVEPPRVPLTRQSSSRLPNVKLESLIETKSPSMDRKKNTLWTAEEVETLLKAYLHHRNDMKAVLQAVSGRSENACKLKLKDLHVVEKILDHRPSSKENGFWELRIRWLFWSPEEDTWEPIAQKYEEEMSQLWVKEYIDLHPDVGVGKVPKEKVFNDVFQTGMSSTKKRKGCNAMFSDTADCSSSEENAIIKKRSNVLQGGIDRLGEAHGWNDEEVKALIFSKDRGDSWEQVWKAVSREGDGRTMTACRKKFDRMTEDEKDEIRHPKSGKPWTELEFKTLISCREKGYSWISTCEAVSNVGAGRTRNACWQKFHYKGASEKVVSKDAANGSGKFSKSPDDEKEQVRRGSQQATSGSFRPTEDNAQPPNEKGRWLSHIIRFFSKK